MTVALPVASGASTPSCNAITNPETTVSVDDKLYVHQSQDHGTEVWSEANPVDGLQREECIDSDGNVQPSDQRELPPGCPPVC